MDKARSLELGTTDEAPPSRRANSRVKVTLLAFALALGSASTANAAPVTINTDSSWLATNALPDFPWLFDPSFDTTGWINASVNIPACGNGADCIWYDGQFSATHFAWLRKTFTISDPVVSAVLNGGIDDDVDVYLNGVLVFSDHDGTANAFGPVDVTSLLTPGVNLIAVAAEDNFMIFGNNHDFVASLQVETSVPEATSLALLASGFAVLAALRRC